MPSKRMVPEQEVAELSDEIVRLRRDMAWLRNSIGWEASVAYRTEIAALTEQRDRAMKVVAMAREWTRYPAMCGQLLKDAVAALDAEAAAETEGT